jgi:hypothetical protein
MSLSPAVAEVQCGAQANYIEDYLRDKRIQFVTKLLSVCAVAIVK